MIIVTMEDIKKASADRPSGYVEEVLSKGTLDNDRVLFEPRIYFALRQKFSDQTEPPLPTKIHNMSRAGRHIISSILSGKRVLVLEPEQQRRMAICATCEFFTGLTCKKCGCHIRFKAKLQTEHCPIGKW